MTSAPVSTKLGVPQPHRCNGEVGCSERRLSSQVAGSSSAPSKSTKSGSVSMLPVPVQPPWTRQYSTRGSGVASNLSGCIGPQDAPAQRDVASRDVERTCFGDEVRPIANERAPGHGELAPAFGTDRPAEGAEVVDQQAVPNVRMTCVRENCAAAAPNRFIGGEDAILDERSASSPGTGRRHRRPRRSCDRSHTCGWSVRSPRREWRNRRRCGSRRGHYRAPLRKRTGRSDCSQLIDVTSGPRKLRSVTAFPRKSTPS